MENFHYLSRKGYTQECNKWQTKSKLTWLFLIRYIEELYLLVTITYNTGGQTFIMHGQIKGQGIHFFSTFTDTRQLAIHSTRSLTYPAVLLWDHLISYMNPVDMKTSSTCNFHISLNSYSPAMVMYLTHGRAWYPLFSMIFR